MIMKTKKRKKKKIMFWLFILLFFGIFFAKEQFMLHQLGDVKKQNQDNLNFVTEQNVQLQNQVKLTKRSDYIENLAREKLGLVKPGEILFIDKDKKR
jgi:cell division protein DivIC